MLPCLFSVEIAPIRLLLTPRCPCKAEAHDILAHDQHKLPTTDRYHCRSCLWDSLRHPTILTGAVNLVFTQSAGDPKVVPVAAPRS